MKNLSRRVLPMILCLTLLFSSFVFVSTAFEAPTEPGHCTVSFFKDADHTEPYGDVSEIDPSEFAYYKISCEPGYFCKRLKVNADYTDGEKIRFGTQTPNEPVLVYSLLGDADTDGDVDLSDVQNFMQRIARWSFTFKTDYVAGDLDGNRTVNAKDCSLLLKYIAGWDVEICDGVAENLEIYSDLNVDVTVKGTSTEYFYRAMRNDDPMTDPRISVIESYEGLVEYTSFIYDYYMMDDVIDGAQNYFSPDEICETYNEEFFEENDLVMFHGWYYKEDNPEIDGTDGNLNIYFTYAGGGVAWGMDAIWHCMIPIPHDSGIDLHGDFSITHRTIGSVVGSGLYLYEYKVRDQFESGFTVEYYE